MKHVDVIFSLEKATKTAIRFREVVTEGQKPILGTFSIPKDSIKELGFGNSLPLELKITLHIPD